MSDFDADEDVGVSAPEILGAYFADAVFLEDLPDASLIDGWYNFMNQEGDVDGAEHVGMSTYGGSNLVNKVGRSLRLMVSVLTAGFADGSDAAAAARLPMLSQSPSWMSFNDELHRGPQKNQTVRERVYGTRRRRVNVNSHNKPRLRIAWAQICQSLCHLGPHISPYSCASHGCLEHLDSQYLFSGSSMLPPASFATTSYGKNLSSKLGANQETPIVPQINVQDWDGRGYGAADFSDTLNTIMKCACTQELHILSILAEQLFVQVLARDGLMNILLSLTENQHTYEPKMYNSEKKAQTVYYKHSTRPSSLSNMLAQVVNVLTNVQSNTDSKVSDGKNSKTKPEHKNYEGDQPTNTDKTRNRLFPYVAPFQYFVHYMQQMVQEIAISENLCIGAINLSSKRRIYTGDTVLCKNTLSHDALRNLLKATLRSTLVEQVRHGHSKIDVDLTRKVQSKTGNSSNKHVCIDDGKRNSDESSDPDRILPQLPQIWHQLLTDTFAVFVQTINVKKFDVLRWNMAFHCISENLNRVQHDLLFHEATFVNSAAVPTTESMFSAVASDVGAGGDVHALLQQMRSNSVALNNNVLANPVSNKRRPRLCVEWAIWSLHNILAELFQISSLNKDILASPSLCGKVVLKTHSVDAMHQLMYRAAPRTAMQSLVANVTSGQTIDVASLLAAELLVLDVEHFNGVLLVLKDSRNLLLKTAMCMLARKMLEYLSCIHFTRHLVPFEVKNQIKGLKNLSSSKDEKSMKEVKRQFHHVQKQNKLLVEAYLARVEVLNIPWLFYSRHRRELLRTTRCHQNRAQASRYLVNLTNFLHVVKTVRLHIRAETVKKSENDDRSTISASAALITGSNMSSEAILSKTNATHGSSIVGSSQQHTFAPSSFPWMPTICVVEVSARTITIGWSLFSEPLKCKFASTETFAGNEKKK
jgi:hypothetical protein